MFDNEGSNPDNREEDIEEKNENNIDLPITNTYSDAVAITYIRWKEQDVINCLESSVLSHLHHFLRISDNAIMVTSCSICYNLNLLHLDFRISQELGVGNKISTITTNM